jgi:hypothetical protein
MANALSLVGCIFIVLLCFVSYSPLNSRLSEPDFQSLSFGPAVAAMLPLFLASFAMLFSVITLYIGAQVDMTK